MALYHFSVTQIKRSAGQSAVASAAYRSGEKLYSEYYGEVSDYTHKGGVVCSEILLPSHAPAEYRDRQTLWNAVEKAERGKNAQLAYSFDIALQNEFSLEENIALTRQFLLEQFVNRGMVVDFAVHQPDREDGGIPNPHFHVMCPIRPIEPDGTWGYKQRREYVLDEHGERVRDEAGHDVFNAVPTTDWGRPETLEHWRQAWADLCNAKFAEKGLGHRIDNRSYLRQGREQIPTVHEGPTVRAMEAKGIRTDKGSLNRWIADTNALLNQLKRRAKTLLDWIADIRKELSAPKSPTLADLLGAYFGARNAGAWSQKAKTGNLKQYADTVNYLSENGLYTLADLEARVSAHREKIEELKGAMKARTDRIKELEANLRLAEDYQRLKPVYDEWNSIKWKGKREKYQAVHDGELRQFRAVSGKLKKLAPPTSGLPLTAWRKEIDRLRREEEAAYKQYKPLKDDLMKLYKVRSRVDEAMRGQEQTKQRHHDLER